MENPLIDGHMAIFTKERYINVRIQYNTIQDTIRRVQIDKPPVQIGDDFYSGLT